MFVSLAADFVIIQIADCQESWLKVIDVLLAT